MARIFAQIGVVLFTVEALIMLVLDRLELHHVNPSLEGLFDATALTLLSAPISIRYF